MTTNQRSDVSIVVTSRNDNHGGNLLSRMQLFVNGLLEQCRRHQLRAELVLVEWNPPPDRPRLSEALSWPKEKGPCTVRIIEVPPEIHRRFKHSERLPLFQMIAKNVGIRRARGRFVLATNIDILFSDEMMRFLVSGKMDPNRLYRVDRYDVPENVPGELPIEQQLEFCRNNVIRINDRKQTHPPIPEVGWTLKQWRLWPVTNATRHAVYSVLRGQTKTDLVQRIQDRLFPNYLSRYLMLQTPVSLHTNACGDFTMLSAERWAAVRAYPELEMYSMHIDSLLCYMAHHSGVREIVLPESHRVYHIEHDVGSGYTPDGADALWTRLDSAGIARLEYETLSSLAVKMRRQGRPIIFNEENWGLKEHNLPEKTIVEQSR
ncbi:MAG: hypothetical protein C5B44_04670 [Acidobacteria bacterium]|nr:MAG: hypothetical protein C5B44_04670 [Acidobacteriota bacterium]